MWWWDRLFNLPRLFYLNSKQIHYDLDNSLSDVLRRTLFVAKRCTTALCKWRQNAMCEHANSSLINLLIFSINIRARGIRHNYGLRHIATDRLSLASSPSASHHHLQHIVKRNWCAVACAYHLVSRVHACSCFQCFLCCSCETIVSGDGGAQNLLKF